VLLEIRPIVNVPAADLVAAQLRRAITLGRYLPGTRLPAERLLAERFEVSRTTIRDALRQLGESKHITVRRGAMGGSIVCDPLASLTEQAALCQVARDRLPEFEELFDLRIALESHAALLAAVRRGTDTLERLERAARAMEEAESIAEFRAADSEFHLGVADASGSRRLRDAIEAARSELWMPIDREVDDLRAAPEDRHDAVLAALHRGDAEASRAAMVRHLEVSRHRLRQLAASAAR
jgi:DNA-binding FadR family transcriptional regulator